MQTRKEILQDEKDLIEFSCSSDTVHTELLLDIRELLIKMGGKK